MTSDLSIEMVDEVRPPARIKVVGVGGAGGSAVNRMIRSGLKGVDFIVINTDLKALEHNLAPVKIQIGKNITRGLGAGTDPNKGREAAEEEAEEIAAALKDTDMIFIAAGEGGGTGTGASPIVARIAREMGILVIAIVTKPFAFEGGRRMAIAEQGIKTLRENVDTLVVIPNQRLLSIADAKTSFLDSFKQADSVLYDATRSIADLITDYGNIVGVDFADVRAIMTGSGDALMGVGVAVGEERGKKAALMALHSPLLEQIDITGAQGVLIHITGSSEMTLFEINEAAMEVINAAGENANVIFGATADDNLGEAIRVTVIATGFGKKDAAPLRPQPDLSMDFQSRRSPNLDIPTKVRREQEAELFKSDAVPPKGNGGGRIHLEVDLDGEPPADFGVPAFLRKNGHREEARL